MATYHFQRDSDLRYHVGYCLVGFCIETYVDNETEDNDNTLLQMSSYPSRTSQSLALSQDVCR